MIKRVCQITAICICLSVNSLFPQTSAYQLSLSKDNISWIWLGRLNLDFKSAAANRFLLKNNFSSNLFRQTAEENKWKDENNLEGGYEYHLTSSFATAIRFRSHVFSDENSFVKFSKHVLMQEVGYTPRQNIRIAPALGWASEDIYSYRDQGWYSQLNVDVRRLDLGGYLNSTDAFSGLYFFPGRRNQEHRYYTAFNKQFSDFASDSIQIGYEFMENSYHLAGSENMENVEVNARYLYNQLIYRFSNSSLVEVETKLQNRDVNQSNPGLLNHRRELNLANRIGFRHTGDVFQAGLAILSSQVTNLASRTSLLGKESRNDIEGLQAAFNTFVNWKMSRSDEARFTFSYTKYEYTSPDTTQTIDEDDLRFITGLLYTHRFSPYFSIDFNANVYLYHQIYINRSRSANNNWNRIFRLGPAFNLRIPGLLEHTSRMKILANYTVYDFENILLQVRSYIYRKFVYSDSLSLRLSDGLRLVTVYQQEREDNGTFFKDIFAQQVSRELRSHFIDLSLIYVRLRDVQFVTGLNWYLRREWSFVPERRMVRDYYAFSPRLTILYNVAAKLLLNVTYSPKTYRDINIPRNNYATGQVNLRFLF